MGECGMDFETGCGIAIAALKHFRREAQARSAPVVEQTPMAALMAELDVEHLIATGIGKEDLQRFLGTYLHSSTRLHHPAYMGHQVAVPHPLAAVGALIDAFINNPMAIYEMGPAATVVEYAILNWMLGKVGWGPMKPPGCAEPSGGLYGGGVLTHGGSLGNLTALAAARSRIVPNAWNDGTPPNLVIVAPETGHYSIARAASILGLGRKSVKAAPADADGRIIAAELAHCLRALRDGGNVIMAVVANAASTAAGLYDPLRDVAEVCRSMDVWLHVDGAHGASAAITPRYRHLMDGIDLADSLVWDAHKMLRTPGLCAAVLVRDGTALDDAFEEEASYLFHDKAQRGFDFIHRTVECTKSALGLKAFFALAAEGEHGLATYIERQNDLAKAVAAFLNTRSGLEVATHPESNIVCFRIDGTDQDQLDMRRQLLEAGRHYISTAEYRGRRWLRLVLMGPDTTMADVEGLVADIEHAAGQRRACVSSGAARTAVES